MGRYTEGVLQGNDDLPPPFSMIAGLQLRLPESMKIAILVYGNGLIIANEYLGRRRLRKVYTYAATLCLYIYEGYVVLVGHRMWNATNVYSEATIAKKRNHGHMLLATGIYRIGDELLHLLSTTYHGDFRVHNLMYHISASIALIKFCSHSIFSFIVLVSWCKNRTKK